MAVPAKSPDHQQNSGTETVRLRLIAAALGIALLAFLLANAAVHRTGFNPDESRWISRAHYLADLADPFGPTWDDQYMTRGQPPAGSYTMGLGLLVQGRDLQTNPPWDFALPWEENIAIGNKPVPEDLLAGRRTSAALVALTTLTLVAIARVYVPLPWALMAGAIFAVHPFAIYIGSIAMADAVFGLFISLAALAAAKFALRPHWSRAALVGILLGLGGATKLSPLAVAVGICAAGLILLAASVGRAGRVDAPGRTHAAFGLLVLLAAAATFVAVYPYLWPDPVGRTRHLFAFRVEEMATQASDWPVMAVPTRAEALRRAGTNFTERFNLAASVGSLTGSQTPLAVRSVEVGLALLGVAIMAAMAIRAGPYSPRALALAVLGGQAAVTILGMRSEFDRYHLPLALLGAVAIAVALHWLVDRVRPISPLNRAEAAGTRAPGQHVHRPR